MKQNILLGMSGGTDSSVAAMILLEQGYNVSGITFRFWEKDHENKHLEDAAQLAECLKIPHIIYDARNIFREKIINYFIDEYLLGRTPFPCAKCNNELKWNLIFQEAERLGCEKVSMGHYVDIAKEENQHFITEGIDKDKDQSFFLWGLNRKQLSKIVFPLGKYTKNEVREIARNRGFEGIATKKDSLGICFCPDDYRSFLHSQLRKPEKLIFPGNFLDEDGIILGKHKGYPLYTVGQRRGLIHLNRAVFVKEIRPETNQVVLAPLSSLYQKEFFVCNYNIIDKNLFSNEFDTTTRIRYRKQNTLSRIIILNNNRLKIELAAPLESIAPGQTAVFYRDGKVLGGGFIE